MKISIIAVGKIKEGFYRQAVQEYSKRLTSYCKLNIIELADEKTPENISENVRDRIKETEGRRILSALPDDAWTIAMAIGGRMTDSPGMAAKIERLGIEGKSHIAFIIGGSLGLSDEVLRAADESLSFSLMTFPHQLMRVILLEQIYRSFRIIRGEPYHK